MRVDGVLRFVYFDYFKKKNGVLLKKHHKNVQFL